MNLDGWLDRDGLTVETLVEAAHRLLPEVAPKQTRYKVTDRPDVRTIRYYTTQKLLPKPSHYEGGRARYTGSHLLRLLLIKRLQAEHQTLGRIARVLEGASDQDVLRALGRDGDVTARVADASPTPSPRKAARKSTRKPPTQVSLQLEPGGTVQVARAVLADPAQRALLAKNLEALADWLRASTTNEGDET